MRLTSTWAATNTNSGSARQFTAARPAWPITRPPLKRPATSSCSTPARTRRKSAEKALEEGKTDFIMFGAARLDRADPDLPNKLLEGRREDVAAPCLFCNQICCGPPVPEPSPSAVRLNAQAVHEKEYPIVKTGHPMRVAVVGAAAPAGLEARPGGGTGWPPCDAVRKERRTGRTADPCFQNRRLNTCWRNLWNMKRSRSKRPGSGSY